MSLRGAAVATLLVLAALLPGAAGSRMSGLLAAKASNTRNSSLPDDCNEDCACAEEKCKACPSHITRFEGACWCTGCGSPTPTPPLATATPTPAGDHFADVNAQIDAIKCEVDGDCECEKKKCELCPFTKQDIIHFEGDCWCLGCK
mmetsp:Transcript_115292/g.304520  ORF Transcript_115292/g.304520 Transcript_115292/m.304520 type:complete len:146 (+) Transcript_115292:71-508(+)